MRLLLTSDIHYKLRQFDWLLAKADTFDAVVVAGDHIDGLLPVPGEVQIAAVSATLGAIAKKTRVFACSGNHDLDARNDEGEMTAAWLARMRGAGVTVDGDSSSVGDTLFTVCPWWDGPAARSRVERTLAEAAALRRGAWIWVYHAPPECALSWNGHRHFGDALLAELVARYAPTAVMCGHIHEAPFRQGGAWLERIGDTWLFNAGRQIGDVPARIEIDLDARTACWYSLMAVDERGLQ